MSEIDPFMQFTSIVQDIGVWAIFAWLFIQERQSHKESVQRHMDDLREVSGIKTPLNPISPDK